MNLDAIGPYNIVHLQLDIEYRNIASIAAALWHAAMHYVDVYFIHPLYYK